MTETMTFNGVELSQYIRIIDIIRPIGNKRSVTTNDAPSIGVNIQQVKTGAKEHTIKFAVKTKNDVEMEQLKHDLAAVLSTDEAVRITYGDEPNKYYLGMVIDDVTPDNLAKWFAKSEFKVIIPDGVAHNTLYRQFTTSGDATSSGGKLIFNLKNAGTVPAYPIITVKNKVENGYISLTNSQGSLEVGSREETDTVKVQQSELLLDYRDSAIITGFDRASKNVGITNNPETYSGSINVKSLWNRMHAELANRGSASGNRAASLTWSIPNDTNGSAGSLNDYLWWRQIFWIGTINQYGFIKVTVSDTNGQFLYGVETFKRAQGLQTEYNFFASDGKGGYNMLKRWTFNATDKDTENPFNMGRGFSDLQRNNDKVKVYWFGTYQTFNVPEIQGKKSAKIHVTLGSIGDRELVTHMYLDGIFYRKDFVEKTKDIPNRFNSGSQIVIDGETDTIYVGGIPKASEFIDGSRWITIPPGNSQLEVHTSSFAKTNPDVTIEFEERWL